MLLHLSCSTGSFPVSLLWPGSQYWANVHTLSYTERPSVLTICSFSNQVPYLFFYTYCTFYTGIFKLLIFILPSKHWSNYPLSFILLSLCWHHQGDGHEFVGSGSWWWTGKPHMLQSMRSQRVGHDWATELSCAKSFQSCPTLCDPWTVCGLPGSSVPGILQARKLGWVAIPSSYYCPDKS